MTGQELATLRRRARLSQSALAQRLGVSRQTISYWEQRPALDGRSPMLQHIADTLCPDDACRLLSSRHGLGFMSLSFSQNVTQQDMQLISRAMTIRKETSDGLARKPCNARTRSGTPCRSKSEPGKSRCRLHGGLSTGPRTPEGRKKIAAAQRRRWEQHNKKKADKHAHS